MNGQYLAAIESEDENGRVYKGNKPFFTNGEPLTLKHLDKVRQIYSQEFLDRGIKCLPENMVIYAVIPLED